MPRRETPDISGNTEPGARIQPAADSRRSKKAAKLAAFCFLKGKIR